MQIPYAELSADTLAAIVLEFVSRDGTDHSPMDRRVATVMRQLKNGEATLNFDPESKSCNIIRT